MSLERNTPRILYPQGKILPYSRVRALYTSRIGKKLFYTKYCLLSVGLHAHISQYLIILINYFIFLGCLAPVNDKNNT